MVSPWSAFAQTDTRIISVTEKLSFGKVEIGGLKLLSFIVSNKGNSELTVSNITLPDGFFFSVLGTNTNSVSATLAPGMQTNFLLFFGPTNVADYLDTITIDSDATGGTGEFTVSGEGEYPTGRYTGLFFPLFNAASDNSGQFIAIATGRGALSGVLQMPAGRYPFSGRFSPSGAFSTELTNGLSVSFQEVSGLLQGTVSNDTWIANLMAFRLRTPKIFDALKPGTYQFAIAGSPYPAVGPTNAGSGTIKIAASETVHLSGTLGDGTKFTQGTILCEDWQVPFYASLYQDQGGILGWIDCVVFATNLPQPTVSQIEGTNSIFGLVSWFKPSQIDPNYPNGFSFDTLVSGPLP